MAQQRVPTCAPPKSVNSTTILKIHPQSLTRLYLRSLVRSSVSPMRPPPPFKAGDIAFLPKYSEVSELWPVDPSWGYFTLPDRCFGHPVIVLALESDYWADILVLTTFGAATDTRVIRDKISVRGHHPEDYLPIHPTKPFHHGAPTVRLQSHQAFVKKSWVSVHPYQCPVYWLIETRYRDWIFPELPSSSRALRRSSLDELIVYADSIGFRQEVYQEYMRRKITPKRPSKHVATSLLQNTTISGSPVTVDHAPPNDPIVPQLRGRHYTFSATQTARFTQAFAPPRRVSHGEKDESGLEEGTRLLHRQARSRALLVIIILWLASGFVVWTLACAIYKKVALIVDRFTIGTTHV